MEYLFIHLYLLFTVLLTEHKCSSVSNYQKACWCLSFLNYYIQRNPPSDFCILWSKRSFPNTFNVADKEQICRSLRSLRSHLELNQTRPCYLLSLRAALPCCLIVLLALITTRTETSSLRHTDSSRHVELLSADYRWLFPGCVGQPSRLCSTTTGEDIVKERRLSPDSTPAAQSQHCSAAARLDPRVTRAQPSAGVQRLIYCLIAWPQFGVKMAVNAALWQWRKGGESESAYTVRRLVKGIGHSLNVRRSIIPTTNQTGQYVFAVAGNVSLMVSCKWTLVCWIDRWIDLWILDR